MKVAFASINGKHLDCHFGRCPSFSIFNFTEEGFKWLESRSVPDMPGDEDEGSRIGKRLRVIGDCKVLFVEAIGNVAAKKAMKAGIMVFKSDSGTEVIPQLEKLQRMLKERPPLWLVKLLRQAAEEEREWDG
ncbi:MAG: hypothetical protein K0R57_5146 [Paenibacillaceae bacterium]|jgi:nitrogen fixation protein NifX|nr:hypothetical protein [Paenibacillaceae bacterium]